MGAHTQNQGGFAALLRDGHGGCTICHGAGRGHGHAHDLNRLALLAEIEAFDLMSAKAKGAGQVLGFALKVSRQIAEQLFSVNATFEAETR